MDAPPACLPACQQGKRYSLREFQDAACANAAKRFGGLHGSLPARCIEVRGAGRAPRQGPPRRPLAPPQEPPAGLMV